MVGARRLRQVPGRGGGVAAARSAGGLLVVGRRRHRGRGLLPGRLPPCRPDGRQRADPAVEPLGGAFAIGPELAGDEVAEAAALPALVVVPLADFRARDQDREAAAAAPAPFLPGLHARLAEEVRRELRDARRDLGVEGLPVPREVLARVARARPAPVARSCRLLVGSGAAHGREASHRAAIGPLQ